MIELHPAEQWIVKWVHRLGGKEAVKNYVAVSIDYEERDETVEAITKDILEEVGRL